MSPSKLASAGAGQKKGTTSIFNELVDFIQNGWNLLDLINHNQPMTILIALSKKSWPGSIFGEHVGFEQIEDRRRPWLKRVGNPIAFTYLARAPQESGLSPGQIEFEQPLYIFPIQGILS